MGNVEWVTCHVPASHSAVGGFSLLAEAASGFTEESVCVEGYRSVMLEGGDNGEDDFC